MEKQRNKVPQHRNQQIVFQLLQLDGYFPLDLPGISFSKIDQSIFIPQKHLIRENFLSIFKFRPLVEIRKWKNT